MATVILCFLTLRFLTMQGSQSGVVPTRGGVKDASSRVNCRKQAFTAPTQMIKCIKFFYNSLCGNKNQNTAFQAWTEHKRPSGPHKSCMICSDSGAKSYEKGLTNRCDLDFWHQICTF